MFVGKTQEGHSAENGTISFSTRRMVKVHVPFILHILNFGFGPMLFVCVHFARTRAFQFRHFFSKLFGIISKFNWSAGAPFILNFMFISILIVCAQIPWDLCENSKYEGEEQVY